MEQPVPVSDNLPNRGVLRWIRKKISTWRTRETAASWSYRYHETAITHRCFPAGINLDRESARRDVSPVADALLHAGGVCTSGRRVDRFRVLRPMARRWPGVPDYFHRCHRRSRGGGGLRHLRSEEHTSE